MSVMFRLISSVVAVILLSIPAFVAIIETPLYKKDQISQTGDDLQPPRRIKVISADIM